MNFNFNIQLTGANSTTDTLPPNLSPANVPRIHHEDDKQKTIANKRFASHNDSPVPFKKRKFELNLNEPYTSSDSQPIENQQITFQPEVVNHNPIRKSPRKSKRVKQTRKLVRKQFYLDQEFAVQEQELNELKARLKQSENTNLAFSIENTSLLSQLFILKEQLRLNEEDFAVVTNQLQQSANCEEQKQKIEQDKSVVEKKLEMLEKEHTNLKTSFQSLEIENEKNTKFLKTIGRLFALHLPKVDTPQSDITTTQIYHKQ